MNVLAKAITYLFFPGAMGFFGFLTLNPTSPNLKYHLLFLIILPLIMVFTLIKAKVVSDIGIYKRSERLIPLFITTGLALADLLLINEANTSHLWQIIYLLVTIVATLATIFLLKISLHGMGVGAFLGLCVYGFGNLDLPLVLLASSIMVLIAVYWSRRALQAHSHKELIAGVATSFLITFVTYTLYGF